MYEDWFDFSVLVSKFLKSLMKLELLLMMAIVLSLDYKRLERFVTNLILCMLNWYVPMLSHKTWTNNHRAKDAGRYSVFPYCIAASRFFRIVWRFPFPDELFAFYGSKTKNRGFWSQCLTNQAATKRSTRGNNKFRPWEACFWDSERPDEVEELQSAAKSRTKRSADFQSFQVGIGSNWQCCWEQRAAN